MTPFELFQAALEYGTPQEQDAFVESQSEHDLTLRSEVKSLLRAHWESDGFLDKNSAKTQRVIETVQLVSQNQSDREARGLKAIQRIQELLGKPENPEVIATIDHYSLLNAIGVGGFGVVFRAMDEKLQRLVAIKMLTPMSESDLSPSKRSLQEARSAAAVNHENVVGIHDVEESPIPYIVMEYVNGATLHEYLEESGPLAIDLLVSLSRQIASGLAAAHQGGFVHRDIKPGNILVEVGNELKAKLTDFGLAQTVNDASLSTSEQFVGTPLYASPEQARSLEIDARSDLFSLGSVMYQMATGQPPFAASTSQQVLQQVRKFSPQPIQQIRPSVPDWLCRIIDKLHEKDPEARFQSAEQLAKLLADCERDLLNAPKIVAQAGLSQLSSNLVSRPEAGLDTVASTGSVRSSTAWHKNLVPTVAMILILGVIAIAWWTDGRHANQPNQQFAVGHEDSKSPTSENAVTPTQNARKNIDSLPKWDLPTKAPAPLLPSTSREETQAIQLRWAEYLKQPAFTPSAIGLKFALIPPGDFDKTFTRNRDGEIHPSMPTIRFRITEPYRLSTTEVTVAQFRAFIEDTKYETVAELLGFGCDQTAYRASGLTWEKPGRAVRPDEPVTMVTEEDAATFCKWLSEKEGRRFRLPTEAEWIHACRAGSDSRFVFGVDSTSLEFAAWTIENSGALPNPVGTLAANPLGLHDMLGNLWERTSDWLDHLAMFPYLQQVNPRGAPISNTIGGCFIEPRTSVHADLIVGNWSSPSATIGFRVLEDIGNVTSNSNAEDWESLSLVPRNGLPMSLRALTSKPAKIDGIAGWSLCLKEMQSVTPTSPAWNSMTNQWFVGGDEGSVTVLDSNGAFVEKLLGPAHATELKISPDGKWVVVKDSNGSMVEHLYVWNWQQRKLKAVLPIDGRFWSFSPDSTKLVFAKQNRGPWNNWGAYELNLDTGHVHSLMIPRLVDALDWVGSPDRIVCKTRIEPQKEFSLEVFDYPTMKLLNSVPIRGVRRLYVSPNGSKIATLDGFDSLSVLDAEMLQSINGFNCDCEHCQWYLDNERLLVYGDGVSKVIRSSTGEVLFKLESDLRCLTPPRLCEEIGAIVVATEPMGKLRRFSAETGRELPFEESSASIQSSMILSGNDVHFLEGERIRTFDLAKSQHRSDSSWHSGPWCATYDGSVIAVVHKQQIVQRQLADGTERRIEWTSDESPAPHPLWLTYSNDGKKLACCFESVDRTRRIDIFKIDEDRQSCELKQVDASINSVTWSSDDKLLAGLIESSRGGSIVDELTVWDATTGEQICSSKIPFAVNKPLSSIRHQMVYSSAENAFMIANGNSVYGFDTRTQYWKSLLNTRLPAVSRAVSVKPDQSQFVVSYGDQFHHFYRASSVDFVGELQAMRKNVNWTKDGSTLLLSDPRHGVLTYAAGTFEPLAAIVPFSKGDQWLICSAEGHYCGSDSIDSKIAYVVLHQDGSQRTYSPEEFGQKFGWKNSPDSVRLIPAK